MKDFFSSVQKNTVDFIDAEKKSKKEKSKNAEGYKDVFSSKAKELADYSDSLESDDSWESGGGKNYETNLTEEDNKPLFNFTSKYFKK